MVSMIHSTNLRKTIYCFDPKKYALKMAHDNKAMFDVQFSISEKFLACASELHLTGSKTTHAQKWLVIPVLQLETTNHPDCSHHTVDRRDQPPSCET